MTPLCPDCPQICGPSSTAVPRAVCCGEEVRRRAISDDVRDRAVFIVAGRPRFEGQLNRAQRRAQASDERRARR